MNLSFNDVELLRQIYLNVNAKITNRQRIEKLIRAGLIVGKAGSWILTREGTKVLQQYSQFSASKDTYGPSESGYYTAGIDAPMNDHIHYHAIEFHGKDKEATETLRDEVVAFLNSRTKKGEIMEPDDFMTYARKVADRVLGMARDAAESAGYNGRMDDGGASSLKAEANAFLAGLNRRIPEGYSWKIAETEVKNNADPEYKTYLRLKEKFGGMEDA